MPSPSALVTGGAGFIGSELVHRLVAEGWRVRVLDNLATGRREHLVGLPAGQLSFIEGDVRTAALVAEMCREVRTVFHLACLGVRHSLHAPAETHEVNATGSLIVAKAAMEARVARFVHVSSSEVYGSAETAPMDERHPCRPTTVYGASKLAGEAYARAFHETYGLPAVIVRPFNAYGPCCPQGARSTP
jgi:UDP-glucose 4-epimerase